MSDPNLVIRVAANLSEYRANVQEGVTQLETWKSAMRAATDAFDGSRVAGQAAAAAKAIENVGGVSALTASEQAKANRIFSEAADKLQLMGKGGTEQAQIFRDLAAATKQPTDAGQMLGEVVSDLAVKYISLEAALGLAREGFHFVVEAIEDAGKIQDLADATGVSTDALQRLGYVGQAAGIDMATMGRAVETFSSKLASGDASAVSAVNRLGLSVKDLLAAGPEQAFVQFADGAASVQDPMQKAALYTEAFGGRLGRLLMALPDLSEAMRNVPKDAIISQENIRLADEFDDSIKHLITTAKAYTVDFAGEIYHGNGELAAGWHLLQKAVEDTKAAMDGWNDSGKAHDTNLKVEITNADLLTNRLNALRADALAPLTEEQKANIDALKAGGVELKEIADLVESNTTAVKLYVDAKKEQDRVEKETAADLAKVRAQLATASIALYASDVERADAAAEQKYEIAAAEAKKKGVVDQAYYDGLAQLRDLDKQKAGLDITAVSKTSIDNLTAIADKARETYDYMIANSEHYRIEAIKDMGLARDAAEAAANGITIDVAAIKNNSIEHLQEVYQNAQATFEAMTYSGYHFSQAVIDHFRQLRDSALNDLHQIQSGAETVATTMAESFKKTTADLDALLHKVTTGNSITYDLSTQAGFQHFRELNPSAYVAPSLTTEYFKTHTLQDAIAAGLINLYAGFQNRAFAGGVTNDTGGLALVGERGPEIVDLPRGANVIPTDRVGAALGGSINVTVVVQGHVLGTTAQQLGVMVENALMQAARARGERYPITRAA